MADDVANARSSILLIDDGDLPALAAVAMQAERTPLVLWHQTDNGPAAEQRLQAVRRHEQLAGAELLITDAWRDAGGGVPAPRFLRRSLVLVQASIIASRHGCSRVIWPVQVGEDPNAVCGAVDVATGVMELAMTEGRDPRQGRGVTIELPVVDLTEPQVVDLADGAGAPMRGFWPCEGGGEEPCGRCAGCGRWSAAFAELGLPWPWSLAPGGV